MPFTKNSLVNPAMIPPKQEAQNESKQVSGTSKQVMSPSSMLHALPIQNAPKITSLFNPLLTIDNISERSETNIAGESSMSPFRSFTGFLDEEPVIVASFNFSPINQGLGNLIRFLNLKEKSRILTARNACLAFDSSAEVKNYFRNYKENLSNLSHDTQFVVILDNVVTLYELLKVQNFTSQDGKNFIDLLSRYGDDVKNYLPSKVWQQALIDLKQSVKGYTTKLLNESYPPVDTQVVKSSHQLSGVDTPSSTSQLWINFEMKNGQLHDLYPSSLNDPNFDQKIENSVKKIANSFENLYIDISKNFINGKHPSANSIINSYSGTGKDIAALSTILFKESQYSNIMMKNSEILKNEYGYDVSTASSQTVFDYIIGKFTDSCLDIPVRKISEGALVNLSYDIFTDETTPGRQNVVLTFENSYIKDSNLTPGSYYYVDSSLQSSDAKKFDNARLSILLNKLKKSNDASRLLLQMLDVNKFNYIKNSSTNSSQTRSEVIKNSKDSNFAVSLMMRISKSSSSNSKDSSSSIDKSSATSLITGIVGRFNNLQKLYLDMAVNNNYQPSRITLLERTCAALLKACSNFDSNITQFSKQKLSRIKAILFLLLSTDSIESDFAGSIKNKLLELLYDELALKNSNNTSQTFVNKNNPHSITDLSVSNVFVTISNLLQEINRESIFTNESTTAYSKLDKVTYHMANFDFIIRIVAAMTPDEFIESSYLQPEQVVIY